MKIKVTVNGIEFEVDEGTSMKTLLDKYGFGFPCGGNGNCGKCKIQCKALPITEKDRVFFTPDALEEGWRIACNKTVTEDCVVSFPLPKRKKFLRNIESCNIAVRIDGREIFVSIGDDEIAETVTVDNPLFGKEGLSGITRAYMEKPWACTNALRGALSKTAIDLFEKYGKARAEIFVIATNGFFAKILAGVPLDKEVEDFNAFIDDDMYRLPTEMVYFLPVKNEFVGGDIFAETVYYAENTLVIDCEDVFVVEYIGKEDTVAATMWDLTYDEIGLKAISAAIRTIIPDGFVPMVKLYGRQTEGVEEILVDLGLNYSKCEKKMENVARAIASLRFRSNLNKECARVSVMDILSDEKFHTLFSEE